MSHKDIKITSKELDYLISCLVKLKPERQFYPSKGGIFYSIDNTGKIRPQYYHCDIKYGSCNDNDRILFDTGNAFLTEEEAEREVGLRYARAKITRFIKENGLSFEPDWNHGIQYKYYISIMRDSANPRFIINSTTSNYCYGIFYFRNREDAETVIKACKLELEVLFGEKIKGITHEGP